MSFERAAQDYFDPPDSPELEACPSCGAMGWVYPCSECGYETDEEDEAFERYRDIERMERESEQAMEEAAAGLSFGGSE